MTGEFNFQAYRRHLEEDTNYKHEEPRNYLAEALAILESRTLLMPQREHLQALAERIAELESARKEVTDGD